MEALKVRDGLDPSALSSRRPQRPERIYPRFEPRIRALVARRIAELYLVEDVVQETFLAAFRFQETRNPQGHPWPWLSKIASNKCSNILRATRREHLFSQIDRVAGEGESFAESLVEPGPGPEHWAEVRDLVRRTLGMLPSRYQRVLVRKHLLGWRYDEIAATEGLSVNAVAQLLFRARDEFKKAYEQVRTVVWLPVAGWAARVRVVARRSLGRVIEKLDAVLRMDTCLWAEIREMAAAAIVVAAIVLASSPSGQEAAAMAVPVTPGIKAIPDITIKQAPEVTKEAVLTATRAVSLENHEASSESAISQPVRQVSVEAQSDQIVSQAPVGISADASAEIDKDKHELTQKVEAKLPPGLMPYQTIDGELYCDGGSQIVKATCDAVDAVPSTE